MICEDATKQAFARTSLEPHFINKDIHLQAPLIKASKGGIVKRIFAGSQAKVLKNT